MTYLSLILSLSEVNSPRRLLRPGGIVIADNILRRGLVADASEAHPWHDSEKNDPEILRSLDEFNQNMNNNTRLEALLLPMFDGLGMARLVD